MQKNRPVCKKINCFCASYFSFQKREFAEIRSNSITAQDFIPAEICSWRIQGLAKKDYF